MQISGYAKKASIAFLAVMAAFALGIKFTEPHLRADVTYRFGSPMMQSAFIQILKERNLPFEFSENVRGETTIVVRSLQPGARNDLEQRMRAIIAEFDRQTVSQIERANKP